MERNIRNTKKKINRNNRRSQSTLHFNVNNGKLHRVTVNIQPRNYIV